jgi:dienelactone hydrolase
MRRSATLSIAVTGEVEGLSSEVEQSILGSPMFAQRDAPPASGTFPVILWSARYGTVAAQSVMSEYLASHGYVVAAVWPRTAEEKLPFEVKRLDEKLEELDAQSDDLRGGLEAVRELPVADDRRAAVVAWSYAGESAWRLAQGDSRIELVIGLDSNVHSNWVYHPRPSEVPMHFRFVNYDRTSPELEGIAHGNFNALEGMIPGVFEIERVQKWSKGGPEAKKAYEAISRNVRRELDATFGTTAAPIYSTIELSAPDGAKVTADLYEKKGAKDCFALFHQSGSSRGEYRTIAPQLMRLGYSALAVDVRWGHQDRWNHVINESAARSGTADVRKRGDRAKSREIRAASRHDLEAAVDWLRNTGCQSVLAWGSSIHANAVFELAGRHPKRLAGLVAVSPGEYDPEQPDRMKNIASEVRIPSMVIWGRSERDLSKPISDAVPDGMKWFYESTGRHGNAVFFEDPATWVRLREFLEHVKRKPARKVPEPCRAN